MSITIIIIIITIHSSSNNNTNTTTTTTTTTTNNNNVCWQGGGGSGFKRCRMTPMHSNSPSSMSNMHHTQNTQVISRSFRTTTTVWGDGRAKRTGQSSAQTISELRVESTIMKRYAYCEQLTHILKHTYELGATNAHTKTHAPASARPGWRCPAAARATWGG